MRQIYITICNKPVKLFYSKRRCARDVIFFSVYPLDKETEKIIGKSKSFTYNGDGKEDINWTGPQTCPVHVEIAKALSSAEELWKKKALYKVADFRGMASGDSK